MIQLFPYFVTGLLVIMIILVGIDTVKLLRKTYFSCPIIRQMLWVVLFFQFVVILVFSYLQCIEIMTELNIGRLAYDLLNKLFHLTVLVGLNGYLRYRQETEWTG